MKKPHRTALIALTAAFMTWTSTIHAQTATLPNPDATNPVTLNLMQGFPPPPEKSVTLGTILKYPNGRWAFHHLRELGPTKQVWRGNQSPSRLQSAPSPELARLTFTDPQGKATTLDAWQKNTYTDALLILHKGKIVYQQTYAGMELQEPHVLWSMSKSLTGLIASELIAQGKLNPNALVTSYLPELKDSGWADANIQQTLDMTTALNYSEDFSNPSSGIYQYLMAGGLILPPKDAAAPKNMFEYLKTVQKSGTHGAAFSYKTVDTEVIGWVLQRLTGKHYATLLSEMLWAPLGAEEDGYVWVDGTGTALTSVGVNATLRDLGRLGEMLRLNGRFNGKQILSEAAIQGIRQGADPEKFKASGQTARNGYSYHNFWWIPHDQDGTFEAKGLNGQHIHINPKAELVIVKLSSHPVPNTIFVHALDRSAFAAIAAAVQKK